MKKLMIPALVATLLSFPALARDTAYFLPLSDVVKLGTEQGKLDGSVSFYLNGARTPNVSQRMGEDVSNKKTNGVGKDDTTACQWAALSALLAFQEKAKQVGANAVVGMHSFYKRNTFNDPANYECHAGAVVVGVTLKGTYAKTGR